MKKYILGLTIISSLFMANVGLAMEKEKKEIQTSLSAKEEAELRQAMKNYKANKSQSKQEKVINKYKNKYPNDPLVKAKLNEKARFDNPQQSEIKEMPSAQQPTKKSKAKKMPSTQQAVKEEIQIKEQSMEGKPNLRITNRESKKIEVDVQYFSYSLANAFTNGTKTIDPKETILMYVPEADRRDMHVNVYVLDSSMNRYKAHGIHKLERIKKGQMVDLIYEDNHKYYPLIKEEYGPDYYQSSKSASHLYEIRNGVTLNHL